MSRPDAIVIGAGIVGAACAERLSAGGMRVLVLEADVAGSGATAAGMGHVVVMDGNGVEFALTRYSSECWRALVPDLPREAEWTPCGTLWVAAGEEEFESARRKQVFYESHGVDAELLDMHALYQAEPNLRPGLAGGLRVPGDAIAYAPSVAAWLLARMCERGGELRIGARVARLSDEGVSLESGEHFAAPLLVLAAGDASLRLLPGLPMTPRKGHLAITDRDPGLVRHQLVELGYLKSAHGSSPESVAFNVQPRATGQLLIGSSRQYGQAGSEIDHAILARMLARAIEYLPGLAHRTLLRTWTGFRAATPDKLPLIGPAPSFTRVWLATGHEGLGVTTSLGTAQLLADLVAGRVPAIDAAPYSPARFCDAQWKEAPYAGIV